MDTVLVGKEITYHFSLNFNTNYSGDEIVETRTIKKEYKDDTSNSLQYLKSDMKTYSIKEADGRIVEMLGSESFLEISEEITFNQFEMFMYKSYDLFSVDMAKLNLR